MQHSTANTVLGVGTAVSGNSSALSNHKPVQGGRFDFDDGGMYCGGWEDGKAHGHGVCTGLKGQGEYSGSWNYGFEVSGVYTWPGGSTYEGHWQNGKRHGLGVESRGRWIYRGEWTQGFKGRYGVRQSLTSTAKYDGTWANGLQDGYGSETYADAGTYQGQWLRGMRHGYGVRTSAAFGMASRFRPKNIRSSMTSLRGDAAGATADPASDRDKRLDDGRGGFVLKARSDEPPARRRSFSERSTNIKKSLFQGLRLKKQHSTGELEKRGTSASIRSTGSSASWMSTESSQSAMTNGSQHTDSNASFIAEDEHLDASVTETYMGEWKNDKRAGFGISERSDGLKYEGEWFNNKKYGYGVTTLKDGTKEEGKYKNNVLITSQKKKHLFLIRSAKFRERIETAVSAAQRASKIALQKADIAISRTSTARGKAELADVAAVHAREDAEYARIIAKQLAPDFQPSQPSALSALSRLTTSASAAAAVAAMAKPAYLASNSVGGHHDADGYPDAATSNSLSVRMEEYGGGGGGGADISRRPSVAIGGVRSPKTDEIPNNISYITNRLQQQPVYSSNFSGGGGASHSLSAHSYATNNNPSFDSGVYTAAEESDAGSAAPHHHLERGRSSLRRGALPPTTAAAAAPSNNNPSYNFQQAMNDHFDHYKRAPSRDRSRDPSMDRFSRSSRQSVARQVLPDHSQFSRGVSPAASTITNMRSVSRQRTPALTPQPSTRIDGHLNGDNLSGIHRRMPTPTSDVCSNGSVASFGQQATNSVEEMLLRQRLGQEIPHTPTSTMKRTESLYIAPVRKTEKAAPAPAPKRKKSLPDGSAAAAALILSREEASVLSIQRRDEMRRQAEEAERLRANPLLYLTSPGVKDWLVRQQLTLVVLLVNASLVFLFYKLLT